MKENRIFKEKKVYIAPKMEVLKVECSANCVLMASGDDPFYVEGADNVIID